MNQDSIIVPRDIFPRKPSDLSQGYLPTLLGDDVSVSRERKIVVAPGVNVSAQEISRCFELVEAAKRSTPRPTQSNFFVRSAAMVDTEEIALGGNREGMLSHAWIHGETAAISTAKQMYGERPIIGIGYYFPGGNLEVGAIASCGNCRDILIEEAPNAIIAAGNEEGIVIGNVNLMRFGPAVSVPAQSISPEVISGCLRAKGMGIEVYLPESLRGVVYVALLLTEGGNLIPGSLYTNAGYDYIPPGISALQCYRHSPASCDDIKGAFFAGFGSLPNVYYRDRQALLELDEVLQTRFNRSIALSVTCMNIDTAGRRVVEAVQTNVAEWMPYPFSPRSFGMDSVIQEMASS